MKGPQLAGQSLVDHTAVSSRASVRATLLGVSLLTTALAGVHLLSLREGSGWTSPLLIGDHLFDLLLAGMVLWYALALGRKLTGPLSVPGDDLLTRNLTALGLGTGTLALGILSLGFLRLYYGPVFLVGVAALTIALGDEMCCMVAAIHAGMRRWARDGMPTAPTKLQRAILVALLLALITTVVRATNPVAGILVDWDAAAYHLASARIYVELHRFVPLPAIPLANAPSGEEMLLVGGLLAGDESLGKALTVLFALALGLAAFALARRQFGAEAAWLAVLMLFSTFWLVILMPLTVTDFPETFFLVLGITDAMAWLDRPGQGDRLLIRAGLLLGFGVSFKLTGLPALPAVVLTLGIARLCLGGDRLAERAPRAVRAGAILGICALIPLAPWLLKNLYFFHSALYPIAAASGDPRQAGDAAATMPSGLSFAEQVRWIASTAARFFQQFVSPLSGLLIISPVVLRRSPARASLLFLVIGSVLWLVVVPEFTPRYASTPRYYLILVALGDILVAGTLYGLIRLLRLSRLICETGLALYLLAGAIWVAGTGVGLLLRDNSLSEALGSVSTDAYLAGLVRPYKAEAWINTHTTPDTLVALVGVTRGLYLDRPYLEDWYGDSLARMEADPRQRTAEMRRWCALAVHFAVFDRGDDRIDSTGQAGIRPFASFAWVRQPGLHPRILFSASGVDVLAVDPCGAAT